MLAGLGTWRQHIYIYIYPVIVLLQTLEDCRAYPETVGWLFWAFRDEGKERQRKLVNSHIFR